MKKKGFTLIELLAVIVVLAIIALIATPIVMNTIKNSKKGAIERGAENYLKQVETTLMKYRLEKGESLSDGVYIINEDGNLNRYELSSPLTIEMNGTKPSNGYIVIENNEIKKEASFMIVDNYNVNYNGKSLYASLIDNTFCKANTEKVSALLYNKDVYPETPFLIENYISTEIGLVASEVGPYTLGVSYTCDLGDGERIFYVLEENNDTISLILGTNLGHAVAYCSDQTLCKTDGEWDNTKGPITANNKLKEWTKNWTNLDESQISLPSAEQLAKAGGQTFDNSSVSNLPTWLYSYKDTNFGFGYWTSTPSLNVNKYAYILYTRNGIIDADYDMYSNGYHIRPVITIPKYQLR